MKQDLEHNSNPGISFLHLGVCVRAKRRHSFFLLCEKCVGGGCVEVTSLIE